MTYNRIIGISLFFLIIFSSPLYAQQRYGYQRDQSGQGQPPSSQGSSPIKVDGHVVIQTLSTATDSKKAQLHQVGMVHGNISQEKLKADQQNRINYIRSVVDANPNKRVVILTEGLKRGVEYPSPVGGARMFGLNDPSIEPKIEGAVSELLKAEKYYNSRRDDASLKLYNQWTNYVQSIQGERNVHTWEDTYKFLKNGDIVVVIQGVGHPLGFEGKIGEGPLVFQKAKEKGIDTITLSVEYPVLQMLNQDTKSTGRKLSDLTRQALLESAKSGLNSGF